MIIIDIAQRDASRSRPTPMISFRRTDADRRPARRFAQPNDGPAPDRQARSDARRAALKRKTEGRAEPHMTRTEGFERNVSVALQAIADGKHILPEIAALVGVRPERTRDFCAALLARGLIFKQWERGEKNRTYTAFYLTDAGRALVTGGEP